MGNPLVRFCEGPRRTEGMAENLGHRMEICGNSGRTIWPKAAVGLGLLDNGITCLFQNNLSYAEKKTHIYPIYGTYASELHELVFLR
jgi:hypothetical protein